MYMQAYILRVACKTANDVRCKIGYGMYMYVAVDQKINVFNNMILLVNFERYGHVQGYNVCWVYCSAVFIMYLTVQHI